MPINILGKNFRSLFSSELDRCTCTNVSINWDNRHNMLIETICLRSIIVLLSSSFEAECCVCWLMSMLPFYSFFDSLWVSFNFVWVDCSFCLKWIIWRVTRVTLKKYEVGILRTVFIFVDDLYIFKILLLKLILVVSFQFFIEVKQSHWRTNRLIVFSIE